MDLTKDELLDLLDDVTDALASDDVDGARDLLGLDDDEADLDDEADADDDDLDDEEDD